MTDRIEPRPWAPVAHPFLEVCTFVAAVVLIAGVVARAVYRAASRWS